MWGSISTPDGSSGGAAAGSGSGAGLGSAFGSFRPANNRSDSMMDDDEDDHDGAGAAAAGRDDDSDGEDADGIRFKRGGISLEQARRIAISSAWRGMRA
jgi:hypothetical protein